MLIDVSYTMSEEMMVALAWVLHGQAENNIQDTVFGPRQLTLPWLVRDFEATREIEKSTDNWYTALMLSDDPNVSPKQHTFFAMDMLQRVCPMFFMLCKMVVTLLDGDEGLTRSSLSEYHAELVHRMFTRHLSTPEERITARCEYDLLLLGGSETPGFRHRIEAEVYLAGDGYVKTVYKYRPGVLDHYYVEHYDGVNELNLEPYMGAYVSQCQPGRIRPTGSIRLAALSDYDELNCEHVFITKRATSSSYTIQVLRRVAMLWGPPTYVEFRYDLELFLSRIHDLSALDDQIAEANLMKLSGLQLGEDDYETLCHLYDLYDVLEVGRKDYEKIRTWIYGKLLLPNNGADQGIGKTKLFQQWYLSMDGFETSKPTGYPKYISYWDTFTEWKPEYASVSYYEELNNKRKRV